MEKSNRRWPMGKKMPGIGLKVGWVLFLSLLCVFQLRAGGLLNPDFRVNLKMSNATLEQVFAELKAQTGNVFVFSTNSVDKDQKISIESQDEPLEDFLNRTLPSIGLGYKVVDDYVVVYKPEEVQQDTSSKNITIKGTVFDNEGLGLPGANVILKGTTIVAVTDIDGNYQITVPESNDIVLEVSFMGFQTTEVKYVGQKSLNVKMEVDEQKLEEVVVTGIVNRRLESFTGSAQVFDSEELRKVGNSNVLNSLSNLDPSFMLVDNLEVGSNPNVLPEIQLRGQSGFPDLRGQYQTDPNQPLFILDGFETTLTKVMDMDMNRVESITILKDAAAKAIYGSKAANGVVVIETKKPDAGQMHVTYNGSINIEAPDLTSYELCNSAEKLQVEYNAGLYDYIGYNGINYWNDPSKQYQYTQEYNELLKEVVRGVNTYWLSQPLRTGVGQKHSIYLDGGDKYFRYGVDLSYNNIKGVMKGSDRTTLTGGVSLSYRYKNITLRNNLDIAYNKATNSPYGSFSQYAAMNPYFRPYDENGNLNKMYETMLGTWQNPMYNAQINTKDESKYTQVTNNFYVEWLPVTGLKLTGRVGITHTENGSEVFYPASHTMFYTWTTEELVKRRGQYTLGDGSSDLVSVDANATYSKNIGKHLFFVNAGWNLNQSVNRSVTMVAEGFPNDRLDDISFANSYQEDSAPRGSESTTHNVGVLGIFNYSYDDRYMADASIRYSGSSQFGSNNRWGEFWSVGLGWNLHKEKFMENAVWLDQFKVRGSWGYTGSQNFSSYQSKSTYTFNSDMTYDGNIGAYLLGLANESLKWQKKEDINIGFDLSTLNRSLTARFDYYQSNTDDLLTSVTVPSSTGFTSYMENLGQVQNVGYEFRVAYKIWNNPAERGFVNVYVSAVHNDNKIKKISSALEQYNNEQTASAGTKPVVRYKEGQSLNSIWAVPSLGIDPATGKDVFVKPDGTTTFEWNSDYLAVCGVTDDKIRGNAGINADFKGFSVNIGMTYRFGAQIYNQTLVDKVENADLTNNVDRRIFTDRWVNPGDKSRFKAITDESTTMATGRFVEDNNIWTLSSVNLSYDFDRFAGVKKAGFQRLRLSFDMSDVTRVSSVKIERGTSYPFARTFSFSLQAMF